MAGGDGGLDAINPPTPQVIHPNNAPLHTVHHPTGAGDDGLDTGKAKQDHHPPLDHDLPTPRVIHPDGTLLHTVRGPQTSLHGPP
jgi:hypothetical protein